jgi:hypothetical protein
MKADTSITITPATVREWEAQAVDLERQAAKKLEEAKVLRARAQAGALLLGAAAESPEPKQPLDAETLFDAARPAGADGKNMMEAVERMANDAASPINRPRLKQHLSEMGFPQGSLKNYFYIVISRLKEKKRITVLDNGDVWRAPIKA